MEPVPVLQVQLCIDAERAGLEALSGVTRRWLEDGAPALGGPLWQRLLAREIAPGDIEQRWGGAPGEVWAECSAAFAGRAHEWGGFSPSAWQVLLDAAHGPSTVLAFSPHRDPPTTAHAQR